MEFPTLSAPPTPMPPLTMRAPDEAFVDAVASEMVVAPLIVPPVKLEPPPESDVHEEPLQNSMFGVLKRIAPAMVELHDVLSVPTRTAPLTSRRVAGVVLPTPTF